MKKIISVTLSLLLLSFTFASCSDIGEQETTDGSESVAADAETTLVWAEGEEKNSAAEVGATQENISQQVNASPETTEGTTAQ